MPNDAANLPALVGQSPAFLDVLDRVSALASLDRPVLVVGERGTGKELIAARLHYLSARWERAYLKLNCGALAETLLETELFGHEAGAFTGAVRRRRGRFELADRGTLFLDEIAQASPAVQEKVLRAIEYGEFERVGSSATLAVDVRVVAAANVDLPALAEQGGFRQDLLDRLGFDVVTLPPLRARRDDIPLLAETFARAMAAELGRESFSGFRAAVRDDLIAYPWPGNVRELKNVVERAVHAAPTPGRKIAAIVFDPFESPYRPRVPGGSGAARGPATGEESTGEAAAGAAAKGASARPSSGVPGSPSLSVPDGTQPLDLRTELAGLERRLIEAALDTNRHHQRRTAGHLGLSYHQLRNLLKKHGLTGPGAAA